MNDTAPTGAHGPNVGYASIFGCVLLLGLPLNAVSLWVLLRNHSLKSPSAVFLVNLTVSDLLLVISLPMRIYFYATGTWPLSSIACASITLLFRDNIRTSSIFITFISVDRLLAVVYPLRSRCLRTSCNAWKAVTLAWLFVLGMNIPHYMHLQTNASDDTTPRCFPPKASARPPPLPYYQLVLVVSLLFVNIVCTAMVFWTLSCHRSDSARVNNKVDILQIFALNLLMFTICFLPVSIGLRTLSRDRLDPLICLASVNCCLDPLLYYFCYDGFWKKKEDVHCRRTADNGEPELLSNKRSERTVQTSV